MRGKIWSLVFTAALLAGCTKDKEVPTSPDGKPMVSRQADPERQVFESELDVPKEFRGKLKKTDLMIWDLKSADGEIVAAQIMPVPPFPTKVAVQARQLFQPIPESERLLFTARIVKFGDEGKPPIKGQLTVMVGMEPDDGKVVENEHVSQKVVDKLLKKHSIGLIEELPVGAKVKAEFRPSVM
jgi:hypothetical protein